MEIIAHRGASFYEPENTLRSIKRAIEMGADFVEVDVRLSKDKELVVIHDADVNRTTNGTGYVNSMTLSKLKKLDAGFGEEIPTLNEVLNTVIGKIKLVVEIKVPEIENMVLKTVQNSGIRIKDVLVTSFYHNIVKNVKSIESGINTGIIFVCEPVFVEKLAIDAGVDVIFPRADFLTKNMVINSHKNGISVYPWTMDDEKRLKEIIGFGVDGVVTNKLIGRI